MGFCSSGLCVYILPGFLMMAMIVRIIKMAANAPKMLNNTIIVSHLCFFSIVV